MNVQTPATRKNDPATSHEAERRMTSTGARKRQQDMAAEAVQQYPGRPSSELARLASLDRVMLGRRLGEIEAGEGPGRVLRIGRGKDPETGYSGALWFPVEVGAEHLARWVEEGSESLAGIRNDFGGWVADRVADRLGRASA